MMNELIAIAAEDIKTGQTVMFGKDGRLWLSRHKSPNQWRSQMYLQMFQDKKKKWRFRLVANNGQTLASSEAYSSKTKCRNTVLSIQSYAKSKTLQVVGSD